MPVEVRSSEGLGRTRGPGRLLAVAQATAGTRVIACLRNFGIAGHWMKKLIQASLSAAWLCMFVVATPAQGQAMVREDRLTTPAGLTLYTFDNDVPGSGKSACNVSAQ